jgi:hypothetical protein
MKIEIIIASDGTSTVETKGYSGSSCREASRFIEQALGKRIGETLTAEYHEVKQQPQIQQREGG